MDSVGFCSFAAPRPYGERGVGCEISVPSPEYRRIIIHGGFSSAGKVSSFSGDYPSVEGRCGWCHIGLNHLTKATRGIAYYPSLQYRKDKAQSVVSRYIQVKQPRSTQIPPQDPSHAIHKNKTRLCKHSIIPHQHRIVHK